MPNTTANGDSRELVLVQFKGHRKSYYHNERQVPLTQGQYCVVEADRGRDMGRITYIGPGKAEWWNIASKQGVLAAATAEDLERLHNNRGDEWEFWDICREKIQYRRLQMNLVSVERQFDHKKITFYFTADKRVDFRELVRDLAAVFRTRIELRQIGVRDEARLKGGLGICGREFCCSTFLHEFVPVTLKMAKVQQLPLNPGKLSGPCGRLRCCMTYEQEVYLDSRRRLPRVGVTVGTAAGEGVVRKLDLLREKVGVDVPGVDGLVEYRVQDVKWERGKGNEVPEGRRRSGGCGNGNGCPKRGGN
jgi:cell fate regulator YaaT (PSP1 superfamily)